MKSTQYLAYICMDNQDMKRMRIRGRDFRSASLTSTDKKNNQIKIGSCCAVHMLANRVQFYLKVP